MPGTPLGWVSAVLGGVLLVCAVAVGFSARSDESMSAVEESRAELRIIAARSDLEVAAFDVVVPRLLDGLGVPGDRSDALADAAAALAAATDAIERLAEDDTSVAEEASRLVEAFDDEVVRSPVTGDLGGLFLAGEDARYWATLPRSDDGAIALEQLSFVEALPSLMLIEALVGTVHVAGTAVDDDAAPLFDIVVDVVVEDGGWLAADASTPLADSEWFELDAAREQFPSAVATVERAFAGSELVALDAWAASIAAGDAGEPPIAMAEAAVAAAELRDAVAPVVGATFDAADERLRRTSAEDEQAALVRLALAAVLALGGVVLVALGAREIRRVSVDARELAALAHQDALTGVGNRHQLDDLERLLADEPRLAHHVVAIIDLDRFKLVNDLHGHAAGDAVLAAVGRRLVGVAVAVAEDHGRTEHRVIRLGGDEFMLSFHTEEPIDPSVVRAALERVRDATTSFSDEEISLAFSIGIASEHGPADLEALMRAADLAVYEDKSARSESVPHAIAGNAPREARPGSEPSGEEWQGR